VTDERPLDERPAARPSEPLPDATGSGQDVTGVPVTPKTGLGCFGIGCLGIIGVVLVVLVISLIVGAVNGSNSGGNTGSSGSSGTSIDPIEQARVVLATNYGESYSYSDIKSITDRALSYFDLPQTNEYRSRVWSSILSVIKAPELSHVSPMAVMRCVAAEDETNGMELSEWIALCAVALK
jgi:uncharacterized membrane protein